MNAGYIPSPPQNNLSSLTSEADALDYYRVPIQDASPILEHSFHNCLVCPITVPLSELEPYATSHKPLYVIVPLDNLVRFPDVPVLPYLFS